MTEDPELTKLTAELEAARKELDSFSYSVSHDLRSPLRIIDGFSEALLDEYRDKLDERGIDYLTRVREAVAGMEHLINGVLELSRISRAPLRPETLNVSEIAGSMAEDLRRSDPERNVTFAIEPGMVVEGDPALIKLAIAHLLGNSWKFTRKHPAANIAVGLEQGDGHRLLYVRDDGAGFDPAYAGRMFTPFQRFHSGADFEGAGIGLAIVQRIVQRHGGKVSAEGKVEQGTTVRIQLG